MVEVEVLPEAGQAANGQDQQAAQSDTKQDATSFIEQGQKYYAKENYAEAAEAYSHAVELLTQEHGEMSFASVDALIAYGRALLQHAIASSSVLGGATSVSAPSTEATGPSSVASSSKAPLPATLPTAEAGPSTTQRANFHFGGDGPEDDEEGDEAGQNDAGDVENEEADQSGAATTPDDDLETAFGVLDMARTILAKVEGKTLENQMKLAGVHESLGEVAQESEKFSDAAQEYVAALDIMKPLLPEWDRRLASTHLMAALAYEYIPQTSTEITSEVGADSRNRAVDHATKAKQVLQARRVHLEQSENSAGREREEQYEADVKRELADIREVSSELDEKIEDLKAMPEIAEQTEQNKQDNPFGTASTLPANAPVNDLGSMGLVKKKKTPATTTSTNGSGVGSVPISQNADGSSEDSKGKRKAEDSNAPSPKKVKFAEENST